MLSCKVKEIITQYKSCVGSTNRDVQRKKGGVIQPSDSQIQWDEREGPEASVDEDMVMPDKEEVRKEVWGKLRMVESHANVDRKTLHELYR